MAVLNTTNNSSTPPNQQRRAPSSSAASPITTQNTHHLYQHDTITLLRSDLDGDSETSSFDAPIMLARSSSRHAPTFGCRTSTQRQPSTSTERAAALDDQLILLAHSHSTATTLEGAVPTTTAHFPGRNRYLDKLVLETGSSSTLDSTASLDSLGNAVVSTSSSCDAYSRNSLVDYDDDDDASILSMDYSLVEVEPPMRLSRMCSCFSR